MSKMCHSCAAPLDNPGFRGAAEDFCKYCTDESGKLKSSETVQFGIAEWFMMWQPGIDRNVAMQRAAIYMKSMPAWAER
ncbi:MAG: hypothetical protein WAU88_06755 [Candidatus Zixiibacteriota bacterium]